MTTTRLSTTSWLASVLDHLKANPNLAVMNIRGWETRIQVGRESFAKHQLADLAAWALSMSDVGPIEVTYVDNGPHGLTNLLFSGHLADGTEAQVAVCVGAVEYRRLAAATLIVVGATFPVALLFELAGATAPVAQVLETACADDAGVDEHLAAAAGATDRQIDATPLASNAHGVMVADLQAEDGPATLGAFVRAAGPYQDEPLNPDHTAQLEQQIGHPIPGAGEIGGGQ